MEKTRTRKEFQKTTLQNLNKWVEIDGRHHNAISRDLGYSENAISKWRNLGEVPKVVDYLCGSFLKIQELENQLEEATRPTDISSDPIEFIKQGLSILNNSIKTRGMEAFIKPDGTIGARIITTVEL